MNGIDSRKILAVLENLNNVDSLRKLFVEKLNYDYANQELFIEFPRSINNVILSTKIISEKGDFKVILCTVDDILKDIERPAVKTISSYYPYNIIVFTNKQNEEFLFSSSTQDIGKVQAKRVRGFQRVSDGKTDNLRTIAERLSKIYAPDGYSPLALMTRYKEASEVKPVSPHTKKKWIILCISDLHVGSHFGLFPKGFKTGKGDERKLNKRQEELWDKWQQMKKDVGYYDTVFLLGDLVSISGNKGEQVRAALKLLRPICKKRHVVRITGHYTSVDYNVNKSIISALKNSTLKMEFGRVIANFSLPGTNKIINIAHDSGCAPIDKGTRMTKEEILYSYSEQLMKIKSPDVAKAHILIRGHYLTYAHHEIPGKHIIWNPGFVGSISNLHSIAYYFRNQPDIGVVKLEITEDDINVIPYLY